MKRPTMRNEQHRNLRMLGIISIAMCIVAGGCCHTKSEGKQGYFESPAYAVATNSLGASFVPANRTITVVAVKRDGQEKFVRFVAGERCTAAALFNKVGAAPFCSHDFGGEHIIRYVNGISHRLPFDLKRVLVNKAEDPELVDGDRVVYPNLRSWR